MKKPFLRPLHRSTFCFLFAAAVFGCSKDDGSGTPPVEPPVEEEVPVAVDDEFTTTENSELTIEGLMNNDTVFDYGRIAEIDSETAEGGTVVDNRDGTFTYTPPEDFIGNDSFEYTLCDNENPPNCSSATVNITVTAASPVAEDDSYETTEEENLSIRNYLANDQLVDNAEVSSVTSESGNATVTLQDNGTIVYSPDSGFSGEDSFTYTICDDDETPSCSTATITVTVVDEGAPEATDDTALVNANSGQKLLDDLLENDILTDEATITSVTTANTKGTVTLNSEGQVVYVPQAGFTGEDTFTYSLCDDDSPDATCVTATVTVTVVESVSFDIPASLEDYYSAATFTTDPEMLFEELEDLTIDQHVNLLEYYMRHDYLYDADAALDNPDFVVLMYSGELRPDDEYQEGDLDGNESFNTEHIYPQSLLASEEAKNDMHLMRVADADINSLRLNYPFTEGSGDFGLVGGDAWYPGDEWKGDVARIIMYVHLKYGEPFDDVGNLEMFLEWNVEDPVSAFELQRQEVISGAQGNRNPFIDNPYLATLLWGGEPAENTWD